MRGYPGPRVGFVVLTDSDDGAKLCDAVEKVFTG